MWPIFASLVIMAAGVTPVSSVPVWGQCGGIGYNGDTNCDPGTHCVKLNDWYHQCQPGSDPTTSTTSSSSTVPTSSSSVPSSTVSNTSPLPTATGCPSIPSSNNYNTAYLPDPFVFADGSSVTTKEQWACRRAEILTLAQRYELGDFPTTARTSASLNGNTLSITATDNGRSINFSATISYPSGGSAPYAAVIAYGFRSIPVPDGVATITFNNNDVANGETTTRGQGKFYTLYGSGHSAGTTTAWAWGVSRIIDALEQVNARIDPTRVGVTGCSRNGKGAFVAGVLEPRIALTLPQESGSGGTNSWRISQEMSDRGENTETASNIAGGTVWLSARFDDFAYSRADLNRLPFDHHLLAATIAPRGFFDSDQIAIDWLGGESSHGSLLAAREVYKALGVPTNLGFTQSGGNNHCQFPSSLSGDLTAFINKFLLNRDAATNITKTAGNYNWPGNWKPWSTPNLS